MRESLGSGWLALVLVSGILSGETLAQSTVRPTAAGTAEISDFRPTAGVHTRRPVQPGPKLLEVESGVELQPIEPAKSARTPKVAGRPAPKTRVIEIPSAKSAPGKATPEKSAPEKLAPEEEQLLDKTGPDAEPMAEGAIELNRRVVALRDRLRKTLDYYYHRKLNTRENNHWEVMHQIVAYGVKTEVRKNSARGEAVNAISWVCWNQPCFGEKLLYTLGGLPAARQGPRVQGHEGQFLKMLAMSGVSPDYPMMVDGKQYKVADLIEQEKLTCKTKMELTFKLISLAYYLEDLDETWRGRDGQEWSIERLIREELTQPILRDAACGGTHRLMGFSMALRQRRRAGQPIDGEYERADKFINDYVKYTLSLQNSDGSFSTEWFRRRAAEPSLDRRLQTTGHILEWLVFTVPDEMLVDARIVRAVEYVSRILDEGRARQWEIGPLGHALHALSIYERRVSYLESQEAEETPETQPEPQKPVKPLVPEKKEPEKTLEKKLPEKKAPEQKEPETKLEKTLPPKKTKGPIKLPADSQKMDEVEPGKTNRKVEQPAEKKEPEKKEPEKKQAEKKLTEPKLEQSKSAATPKKPEPERTPKAKSADEDEVPAVESPKTEDPKKAEAKAEKPETPAEKPAAEQPKPAEKPAQESEKPAENPEEVNGEPKLPGEPTPADPAQGPATEKQPEKAPEQKPEEKPAAEEPKAEKSESKPAAEKGSERAEEKKPSDEKKPSNEKAEPAAAEPADTVEPAPSVIKSAPVEQAEPAKRGDETPVESKPAESKPIVSEPIPAEESAETKPAAEDTPAEKPESGKVESGKAEEKFNEPRFDLDPLADPEGKDARAPRNLDNLDDLSRAGRLPPVDGADDIRTASPPRKRGPSAPDLWDSPVFDPHRENDDVAEREPKLLPAPPVEAVDSPSQPVARVGGRTLRSTRTQGEAETSFPKILKRRLGILFVPKNIIPAR